MFSSNIMLVFFKKCKWNWNESLSKLTSAANASGNWTFQIPFLSFHLSAEDAVSIHHRRRKKRPGIFNLKDYLPLFGIATLKTTIEMRSARSLGLFPTAIGKDMRTDCFRPDFVPWRSAIDRWSKDRRASAFPRIKGHGKEAGLLQHDNPSVLGVGKCHCSFTGSLNSLGRQTRRRSRHKKPTAIKRARTNSNGCDGAHGLAFCA